MIVNKDNIMVFFLVEITRDKQQVKEKLLATSLNHLQRTHYA